MHGLLLQLLIIRSKKYENKKVKIRKIELHLTRFISKYVGFWGYRKWFRKRNFGIFLHCLDGSLRSVWSRGPIIAGNGLETWQSFSLYVLLTILGVDFIESVRDNSQPPGWLEVLDTFIKCLDSLLIDWLLIPYKTWQIQKVILCAHTTNQ